MSLPRTPPSLRRPFSALMHVCTTRLPPAGLTRGSNLEQLQQFVKDVAKMDGVYFITMRQLIAWMQASRAGMAAALPWCSASAGARSPPPPSACLLAPPACCAHPAVTAVLSCTRPPCLPQDPVPLGKLTPQRLGCGNEGGAPGSAGSASGAQQDEEEPPADGSTDEPPADTSGSDEEALAGEDAAANEPRMVSPLVAAPPSGAAPAPAPAAQWGGADDGTAQQLEAPELLELSAAMRRDP